MKIIHCRDYNVLDLEQAELSLLESACMRLPGIRGDSIDVNLIRAKGELHKLFQEMRDETIYVIPISLPSSRNLIMHWHKAILRARPLPVLCAVCFVLMAEESVAPTQWLDGFWIETLDEFTELAVPSSFVVWNDQQNQLKTFRVVSALSSLAREIENLSELSRLDERIAEMEETIEDLGRRLNPPRENQ